MKNMEKKEVVALGELLIDFTQNGMSEQGNLLFEANPGGAPCNVLSMLTRLGHTTSFIGKVGDDMFGNRLESVLQELGIGSSNLVKDKDYRTTLAFVHTAPDGDRDFSFYRKPGADIMLTTDDIDEYEIENCKIFHFGSLSLTNEPVRSATMYALSVAKRKGVLISFDPNVRLPLWESEKEAVEQIKMGLSYCDILKIAEEELEMVTGCSTIDEGVQQLKKEYQITLISVTKGKEGSCVFYGETKQDVEPFKQENVVDTTGAGDTFCACVLHGVLEKGLDQLNDHDLYEIVLFANAAASLIVSKKGSLYVMPNKEDIMDLATTTK